MTHRELNPQPWNYLCIALSIQAKDTEPVNRTRQQHKNDLNLLIVLFMKLKS